MRYLNKLRHVGAATAACAVLSVLGASPASATRIWYGTFNGMYGGQTVENIGGPDQEPGPFGVIGTGLANIYRSGEGGVNCGVGFTSCLSLEASDLSAGTIRTLDLSNPNTGSQFSVLAGDAVTVSFELSGNQRSTDPLTIDRFAAGLFYDPQVIFASLTRGGAWTGTVNPSLSNGFMFSGVQIAAGTDFRTYTMSFVAPQDMNFAFQIRGGSGPPGQPVVNDGLGPILRSVAVDVGVVTAVPEPGTWALMIAGFGAVGGVLRRRRSAYA